MSARGGNCFTFSIYSIKAVLRLNTVLVDRGRSDPCYSGVIFYDGVERIILNEWDGGGGRIWGLLLITKHPRACGFVC